MTEFPPEVGGSSAPAGRPETDAAPAAAPAERQETGGPNRTPRSEIGPAVSANRK
jgi:hypothetical protein